MSSTAPDDLEVAVRAVLSATEQDELDTTGILDVLWLAATLDAAAQADSSADEDDFPGPAYQGRRKIGQSPSRDRVRATAEEAARDGPDATRVFDSYDDGSWVGGERIAARRVTLGGQGPLPGKLELARSLRPFRQWSPSRHRRVLDVEATIRATAASGHTLPILRAAKERRFSVDVVFDVSPSMLVWWDAFAELTTVFKHVGAFRDVKQWRLHAGTSANDVWLTDRSERHWRPSALRSADRRRITLIVTDAVAEHWYTPQLWRHLTDWGMSGTVALLDLLPLKLWNFSGIGPNRIRVRATSSAAPNAELRFNVPRRWRLAGRSAAAGMPFPVVELSPAALAGWSSMVAAAHPAGSPALLVEASPPYGMTETPPTRADGEVSLKNFLLTASPTALRLAVMAATSEFTTVAVLRAIQRELFPGSAVSDLAEVLVSGIYQHVPDHSGDGLRIRMDAGCRAELQKQASPQDGWDVFQAISTTIQREDSTAAATFQAAVYDVSGDITLPRKQQAFAAMARTALAQAETLPLPAAFPAFIRQEEHVAPPSSSTVISPETDRPSEWDFFVSFAPADRAWAEWIAWVLEENGHRVMVASWDLLPGDNWIRTIDAALTGSARTIAVLSPDYLQSRSASMEWQAAWASDPAGEPRRLLLVRVRPAERPGLLAGVVTVDLFGVPEAEAKTRLLDLASSPQSGRSKPTSPPNFPGRAKPASKPPFPSSLPDSRAESSLPQSRLGTWNLPPRNPAFTGREAELATLAAALDSGHALIVQSLRGLGGVGKTQLAVEFAYQHAPDYDVAYLIAAEEPTSIPDQFAGLAAALGLEPVADPEILRLQVHDQLSSVHGWLLIFDNADSADAIRPWLPNAPRQPGISRHVIITTRRGGFRALGAVLNLDVLTTAEAVAVLQRRVPSLDPETAQAIAVELGSLPLALAQAAAYMDVTAISGQEYLGLLRRRRADLHARGQASDSTDTVATLWSISTDRIRRQNPAATQLLSICAYMAPESIPLELFTAHLELLPGPLSAAAADVQELDGAVALLTDYSLASLTDLGLTLHPLVQAVTRSYSEDYQRSEPTPESSSLALSQVSGDEAHSLAAALDLLAADVPELGVASPETWPRWAVLLPHVLAVTGYVDGIRSRPPGMLAKASELLGDAGTYLTVQGRPSDALHLLERATALAEEEYGPDHPEVARRLNHLASIMPELGQPERAQPLAERALAIDEAEYGADHPEVANDLNTLATILVTLGQPQRAQLLAERALAIDEATHGPDHPEVANDLNTLASILRTAGQPDQGLPLAERALAIDEAVYGPDHPNVAISLNNLTAILLTLQQPERAQPVAERALAIDEAAYGPDHPEVANDLNNLVEVLNGLGQQQEARPLSERALAISERVLGPGHPYTLRAREALASITGQDR